MKNNKINMNKINKKNLFKKFAGTFMAILMGLFLFGHNNTAYAGICDPGDPTSPLCPTNPANPASPAQQAMHTNDDNNKKDNTDKAQENQVNQSSENDSLFKIISFIQILVLFLGVLLLSYIIFKVLVLRR